MSDQSEADRLATIAHAVFRDYGYQGLFNAVAAAVRTDHDARLVGISVRAFLLDLISQDERGRPYAPAAASPSGAHDEVPGKPNPDESAA